MKETSFLRKLKKEGKIGLVEPSEEMRASYSIKAENCLKSAKILFQNQLYENSTSEAYYCIYNSLLSLLFKIGIKSENHSASIVLFKEIFDKPELTKIISWAKNERIDKQYYVESHQVIKATKDSC
ncbi:DNA-binding protein, partial [Candidatus Woesearchaeota archaeon CG10_big_fil_rev_8_21_14_0_10_34_12]